MNDKVKHYHVFGGVIVGTYEIIIDKLENYGSFGTILNYPGEGHEFYFVASVFQRSISDIRRQINEEAVDLFLECDLSDIPREDLEFIFGKRYNKTSEDL